MADKTVSIQDVKKLESEGSTFDFDPDLTKIDQFGDLVEALNRMVANEAERIRMDIARNQTNLEILATLQSLIKKQGSGPAPQPTDLSPIKELLEEIRAERTREPADYDFNIIRPGGDGFQPASRIEARAIKPTTH